MEAGKEHSVYHHAKRWELISFGVLVLAFVFGVGMDVSDQPFYEKVKVWLLPIWALALLSFVVPAGIRCAAKGMKSVWSVVALSAGVLALVLLVFYTTYFWAAGADPGSASANPRSEKFLNFPPMLVALWVAGVGWYITFQATAKNHRTTNAFNLIMQTRTSREFLERSLQVQLTYPHGKAAPIEDEDLFNTSKLKNLTAREQEQKADKGEVDPDLQVELFKARGADALKYLLNYYEFMAVAIEARDLEEDLLYNTIGVSVTSVYRRSRVFIDYVRDPAKGNQPLAFDQLEKLVAKWERRLKAEITAKD